MSTKGLAFKYVAGQLRGDKDSMSAPDQNNGAMHLGHKGAFIAMHSAKPDSIEAYEEWFEGARSDDPRGKAKATPEKIRRAVLMRRDGRTWEEVRRATSCASINEWVKKLPEELRP